jgi:hypothetical protein
MSVRDEEDFYEFNNYTLPENFESDVFIFLKKLPPLIYILLFFCLSLIIVSLVDGSELYTHADCTTKLEETAVVKEEDEIVEDSSQKINLPPIFIKTTTNLPSHEKDDNINIAKDDQPDKHGQHYVQMDSDDEVSMGDKDDQSNYHERSDGDAIRRAVEEARLAEKKRTEEAITRTKARAYVPKNRRYFLLHNSV